ncbi:hypothetical protein G7K_5696-t3 [Saitoella complicata NRRL Y-17804]|uniref:RRM domain-containing protein n=1 Tax=Saitoella complicata (strain BCRC 22490 / CBS 7301 / JCM 7358 / NBRC 10748 / NRRL Y-17804) TaxID=698492 RepID=A0A0E9NNY7_SAICN|nr:hypothetical protein G7K_5696-t3 [Saitoella complicata NRRL Y-17804]
MMNLDGARARNRASTPTPSYTSSSTKQSIAIMSANLDRSLDEILATKPKRGGIRKAKGAQMRRKNNAGPAAQAAVAKAQQQQQRQQPQVAAKDVLSEESRIMLSNLPLDVPEPQIKDLLLKEIGPVKKCQLMFGPNGQSRGTCAVTFSRKGDAQRAYEKYNGRLVDGKKAMKVEVLVDPTKAIAAAASLANRLAPLPRDTPKKRNKAAGNTNKNNNQQQQPAQNGAQKPQGAKKDGARKPKNARLNRPAKTADELDAEMADYFDKAAAPAPVQESADSMQQ